MLASFETVPFAGLKDRLLQGGVRPRHARRYLSELQDHLDDLIAEERRAAADERDARARALARLGSTEALAGAMIARPELRAWSSKAPALVYVIAPSTVLVACTMAAMAAIVIKATSLSHAGAAPTDLPVWLHQAAAGVVVAANSLLAVALGWGLAAMAIRQRSAPRWGVARNPDTRCC